MIKDIPNPEVEDVYLAVVQEAENDWKVYLMSLSGNGRKSLAFRRRL